MKNQTLVVVAKRGMRIVAKPIDLSKYPLKNGVPVEGPNVKRLLTVKEIAKRDNLSLNKAQDKRRLLPELCLAEYLPYGERKVVEELTAA